MIPDPRYYSRLDLACEPSAVRRARDHARDLLAKWGLPESVVDDALMIVSELASNAVRHAGEQKTRFTPTSDQPRSRGCRLSVLGFRDHLYLAFYDEARDQPPVMRDVSLDAESGRGITLVHELSHGDWGWSPSIDEPGKIVWARVRLPALTAQAGDHMPRPLPCPLYRGADFP